MSPPTTIAHTRRALLAYLARHGAAPTLRELAALAHVDPETVRRHLRRMPEIEITSAPRCRLAVVRRGGRS